MDQTKLIKAREYYDKVKSGVPKKEAALAVVGHKNPKKIEESDEYLAIVAAASQLEKQELKKEIEQIKKKQIKSYSNLLDKGEELMEQAETVQDKIAAQANQRANLTTGVLESALAWDGEDRNKNDLGDVLEGVIV